MWTSQDNASLFFVTSLSVEGTRADRNVGQEKLSDEQDLLASDSALVPRKAADCVVTNSEIINTRIIEWKDIIFSSLLKKKTD
jgi:hypothetical protein